jgi:hypothetical protein
MDSPQVGDQLHEGTEALERADWAGARLAFEGIDPTSRIGVELDLRGLARCDRSMRVHPMGFDLVFEHDAFSPSPS